VPTAVVCDDDPALRGVISELCNDAGIEVVAETNSGGDAVTLIRRFGIDVLVLDVSLVDGSGERALEILQDEGLHPAVVIFTDYAADTLRTSLGVREVVHKPDVVALAEALLRLGASLEAGQSDQREERRLASRPIEEAPAMWRSPSGVSPTQDLSHSYLTLEPGDAALVVRVLGLEALEADVGPFLVQDCRLSVARLLRHELRVQDLLHQAPGVEGFVALLRGGDARAATAVWSRLTATWRRERLAGELHGADARVDSLGGADAVARAVGALQALNLGGPSFVSV